MPLKKGHSKATIKQNFHEVRHGKTFKRTERKFGKARAVKQMEAIVLGTADVPRVKRQHAYSHKKTGFGRGSV